MLRHSECALKLAHKLTYQHCVVNKKMAYMQRNLHEGHSAMVMPDKEREYADRLRRFLKAELKRGEVSYKELANRLTEHGLAETETGIASKMARGLLSATFFMACLAVLEREGIRLAEL